MNYWLAKNVTKNVTRNLKEHWCPEMKQDIENWMPSGEVAQKLIDEIYRETTQNLKETK